MAEKKIVKSNRFVGIFIAVILCELVGYLSSMFTLPQIPNWYDGLNKSFLTPPNWVFGAVWIVIFALMGVSAYMLWEKRAKSESAGIALEIFIMQIVLNVLWSILFFGLRLPLAALWEMFALWLSIAWLFARTYYASKQAAYLLIPYLVWISFAIYLNYVIVALN